MTSRWLLLIPLLMLLSACGALTRPGGYYEDDGPAASPPADVANIPDAVPKAEPRSTSGNKPYSVYGTTYTPLSETSGYRERGIASWYGTKFHGRRTSSGETYDMYAMTAAHKTLPLPTYVTVRNLYNGHSITVKVNDRGPFHENRVIDLSYVAAIKLGIVKDGTGLVEVRAIDPGYFRGEPVPVHSQTTISKSGKGFYVQVGAFSNYENALQLTKKLTGLADNLIHISETIVSKEKLYRVRFGPITEIDVADRIVINLGRYGVGEHRIVVDL